MKDELINFETAKLAKEKGFFDKNIYNEVRLSQPHYYDNNGILHKIRDAFETNDYDLKDCFNAPTQSLLQKWLREIHNIHIKIHSLNDDKFSYQIYFMISKKFPYKDKEIYNKVIHESYELALEDSLKRALKLIKL